jgi:hypothetical protein
MAALAAEKRAMFRGLVESAECTFKPNLRLSMGSGGDGSWRCGGEKDVACAVLGSADS